MSLARGLRAGVAALAAVAVLGPPAQAAAPSVAMDGNVLRVNATDGTRHGLQVSRDGNFAIVAAFAGDAPATLDTPQCSVDAANSAVRCGGAGALTLIVIRMGAGDDTVALSGDPGAEADIDLGDGGDLFGGGERRSIVRGGAGADLVEDSQASSVLDGGPGTDTITPGLGSDDVLGGPGLDLVDYAEREAPLQLSLDGIANDGDAAGGEHDNLVDVEAIVGGEAGDQIRGNDALNDLDGGEGPDRIDGGGGFDRLVGGADDDTLLARDGFAERVECGNGADQAVTDDFDAVQGCEAVDHSPDLQPDRDGDGVLRPTDCDDLNATVRPGAFDRPGNGIDEDCLGGDAVDLDQDRDGFAFPLDCDDHNRAIRPGAGEIAGNLVDEDCDRAREPFPRITATLILTTQPRGRRTRVLGLIVADIDGGERIAVACRGGGCGFKRRRARAGARAEQVTLDRLVRGLRLRPRARLTVTVRRADGVRRVMTATMRAGKSPQRTARCVQPRGALVAGC